MGTLKSTLRSAVNRFLTPFNIEMVRKSHGAEAENNSPNPHVLGYVSAKESIEAAKNAGLSVSDYLEKSWDGSGHAKKVIDQMQELVAPHTDIKSICEIGTGSGMYLEKVLSIYHPIHYESYEPDKEWAQWLAGEYHIISHDADGKLLRYTESSSVDLVHAHGVFVYIPFLTSYRYFQEIARVTKDGGYAVFDIMSEECFDESTVQRWLQSDWNYPCLLAKQYVIDFFVAHGFLLLGEFPGAVGLGKSLYLVLQKSSPN